MSTRTNYCIALAAWLAGASVFFVNGSPAHAAGRNPALSTPDLLVDLARDHGLNCRGKQTAADVLHVKTLLRAALRLDPRQAQACVWLYELALYGDQPDEAAEILAKLVATDPGNTAAFSNWLEMGPPDVQTVEQRQAWLAGLLGRQQRPENLALVHTHLARIALQQVDEELARAHLKEALRVWPECPDAVMAELELATPGMPPAERLDVVLRALRANPVQAELAWEAGLLLDENGLADEALAFYEHASSVHTAAGSGGPLLPDKLLQLSRNALARGDREAATGYAQQAAFTERGTYEARFHLCWLFSEDSLAEALEQARQRLAEEFAAIKEPADWPVGVVSQAAWFYCIIDEQPQRALMLAEDAAARTPGDLFTARVLGWAQALNGRAEEAQKTLEPIAKTDPYAAYRLARLLREAGDEDAPARLVRELAYVPPVGRARQLLDELGVRTLASRPAAQRLPEVVDLLSHFDRAVLGFHRQPARFLAAEIEFENPSPAPGEPWWAVFSLTNRADFPVTLGPDWMLNPVFLLSFQLEGDRKREYPDLLTVSLDRARVIRPGETLRARRTINVGPLRKLSRRTPQHLQSVSVSAILDPQQTASGWQPSATGLSLRSTSLVRLPANTDPEAWHARFGALKGDSPRARFQALEVMGELLGEQQRAAAKPLNYKPQPIPTERVKHALRAGLESESWETRVRTLDALQVAGLDRTLVEAARQCLEHPHWAVRMMAVRLLARQGKTFAETAGRIAAEDEDELVRDMARSYLERWSVSEPGPTTQPQTP
ncbi:MAG: HEAT repeat domain-containing protein [Planctomycetes bacterium]|nr:HEAT repeat domain-containing protein [Planctomycetota bacterium]